jgi:acyl-CoA synthetase (AMP-forming)/AMP-acid ligase II
MGQGGSIFMGVPTMYSRIVEELDADPAQADWLKSARLFTSGSAALSPNIFERFKAHTGHEILERYGMSETLLTLSNPYLGERRPGTVGRPVPGCDVRVVDSSMEDVQPGDVGEIVVQGPTVMDGYWNLPDKTDEAFRDGWFLTGDVATVSADGYVSIVGRRSVDIIKSGGYKISAREIEEVLERHADVRAVAVVGIPDETWGERIGAAVVLTEGVDTDGLLGRLADHCDGTIADYKQVRDLIVVDAIPRNALGKVQKHKVIELFG